MPGHGRRFVVQDDVGDILPARDRLRDRNLTGVEKGRVAHKNDLLIIDKGIDPAAGAAAEPHSRIIVHQGRRRFKHEHAVTTGVPMRHQVNGTSPVMLSHVLFIQ